MADPCYPVIAPVRLVHRSVRHVLRHKAASGVTRHAAPTHVQASPQITFVGQNATDPLSCSVVPGALPAGPGARAAESAGAQPMIGREYFGPVGVSSTSVVGGSVASTIFANSAFAGLGSLPKTTLAAAALLVTSGVAALPTVSDLLHRSSQSAKVVTNPLNLTAPTASAPSLLTFTAAVPASYAGKAVALLDKPFTETPIPSSTVVVPEPASLLTLGAGVFTALAACRRRRR